MSESTQPVSFDDAFWDNVVARHWSKQPFHIPKAFATPFVADAELLAAMRNLAIRTRGAPGNAKRELAFFASDYREDELIHCTDPFPADTDTTVVEYFRRLFAAHGECCVGGIDIHTYHPEVWERVRGFIQPLLRRVGQPAFRCESVAFIGEYPYTSTGVHRDSAHVWTFMLKGTKTFHLWPDGYPFKRKALGRDDHAWWRDYGDNLDGAITFVASEGDLLYWPPSFWHVVESPVYSNSMTVLWKEYDDTAPHEPCVARWIAESIAHRSRDLAAREDTPPGDGGLPEPLEDALQRFVAAQEQPGFHDHMWRRWLARTSRCSFDLATDFIGLAPRAVAPGDALVANEHVQLEWTRLATGPVLCAANGQTFELPYRPELARVLSRIVGPQPWTPAELAAESGLDAGELASLVEQCVRLRVVLPARAS